MKKKLLLISFLLVVAFCINAQITITQNDMPYVGIVAVCAEDTVLTGISVGNSGITQTWNFSNILNQKQTTESFVSPAGVPGSSNFPSSNLADTSAGSGYIFYQSGTTSINILGFYIDMGSGMGNIPVVFTPSNNYLTFPCNYLTSFNNNFSYQIKIAYSSPPLDSVKTISHNTYSSIIDGYGSITTPVFTNVPCLRQKITTINIDSSFYHIPGMWISSGAPSIDTTVNYNWFANGIYFPLVQIEADGTGNITSAKYLLSATSSLKENFAEVNNKVNIFPNPVIDNVGFAGINETSKLFIYNITGKLLLVETLKKDLETINVSNYKAGLYFYRIVDLKGSIIDKGKFEIVK